MDSTDVISIQTVFGKASVEFEHCPLMKQPVSIHMGDISPQNRDYVYSIIYELFYDQTRFTKDVILTDKYNKIFP